MNTQNNAKIWVNKILPMRVEITYFYIHTISCRYTGEVNGTLLKLLADFGCEWVKMSYGLFIHIPHDKVTRIEWEGL